MKQLAIVCTHPIQYYAPFFQKLAASDDIDLKVFYTRGDSSNHLLDKGFGKKIEWDIPLLENYCYEFLNNISKDKGTHHFNGIINPDIILKLNSFCPQAILVYGWAWNSHLKVLRHFHGKIPIWFRGDSTLLDNQSAFKRNIKKLFLTWVYSKVDLAFYVGQNNKTYFKEYGLLENQLIFSPHAIDNDRFSIIDSVDKNGIRNKLNVVNDEILVLFAGKFESKKSPELLLNAYIKMKNKNVHLLFVGNGVLEARLKGIAKKINSDRIHFLDFQNQNIMPSIYQSCDLFCLPSGGPNETWGLAVNEAMACSKAILASTKVGCAVDLIIEKVNGGIFQSNDVNDLSLKLDTYCTNRENLASLGRESYKIIKNWNFDEQISAVQSALQNL